MIYNSIKIVLVVLLHSSFGCQFYPLGEYLRFVRVPENLKVGEEVLRIEVHPRNNLNLLPVDKDEDVHYFTYRDINRTSVSLLLAKSLEDLVDTDNPRNVLKFKLTCDYNDGEDTITSSLSVTVYVEDVNDHAPIFLEAPYSVAVDELTPVGLIIFRGIQAVDRDKPNTPNSDVQYAIIAGNERGKFALESSHQAALVLKKSLDYDSGDREFLLTIMASDRGSPPKTTNATISIKVNDNDDLPPKFTKGVYRTKIKEFYPITGARIHERMDFVPPIYAFDQDFAIDAPIRYDIIAGNERHLFYLDHVNGSLFLEREIDLDAERSLPGNTFVLQIQASQVDNPLKIGVARVEIEIIDLNDNLPEFEVDFYNISIVENLPNGFSVLQIIATDQDQGDNADFSYQLDDKSGAFSLDSRTGWLTVRDQTVLDREKRSAINMRVYAKEKLPSVVTSKIGTSSVNIEVTLLDANDNNPSFIPNNLYNFLLSTSTKKGDAVGQVHAIDQDLGKNGLVMYSIQKAQNNSESFRIDPKSGQLFVNVENLTAGTHLLFVEAADQPISPSEKRTSLAVVSIDVKDNNSEANQELPEFIGAPYEFWVGTTVGIGTSVGQVRITEKPEKSKLTFDLLHSYHEGVPFAIEEKSGTITVVDSFNKYNRKNYDFETLVTNENNDFTMIANVTIHVVDPKDEKTILMKTGKTPLEFHVKENQPNVLIGKLGFKNNLTASLKFSIANQKDVTDVIAITTDGTLYTLKSLDRELRDIYRLTVIAEYSRANILGTGIYQVVVYVDDENDNRPMFERDTYEGKITENCRSGTEVDLNFPIHVNDKDIGNNGQFSVTILGNGSEYFRLDRRSGRIQFTSAHEPLDRERKSVYHLRLVAKDNGGLYSEAQLTIRIEDENDNPPVFSKVKIYSGNGISYLDYEPDGTRVGHFEEMSNESLSFVLTEAYLRAKKPKQKMSPLLLIPEDIGVGSSIVKLTAQDKDAGENAVVKYEMVSETYIPNEYSSEPFHLIQYFAVHSVSGEISVSRILPPESEFRLNISSTDNGGLKDHITLRILVKDVNDHPPVFKKSWYTFDTEEASYKRKILGKIEAMDADFGVNANITYFIKPENKSELPFTIGTQTGVLTVEGLLDREVKDKYAFRVIARDNPLNVFKSLSSTVNVEVNVLDINDNYPVFYGFDETVQNTEANTYSNHNYQGKIPIYYASVPENSPVGTPVTRVFANDSDFTGNGNGLILFDIPYKKSRQHLFAIDSKEGVVTTVGKLDYEVQKQHNITIIASDLGSPSLSSTALLSVSIIDVPEDFKSNEHPVFVHRYYEVEVEENVPVPLKLLQLNVTEPYRNRRLRYSIVSDENPELKRTFRIDPRNGSLYIMESPDRELKAMYELKIRLDQYKVGRDMTVMVYPVTNERLGNLGLNEVKVIVRVTDVNDNAPKFIVAGRPIVTAVPTSANYGHQVVNLKATDPDLGLNGEVRYQILSKADEASRRFAIDPMTGQVRAIASFAKDAGKVFGFDVKATDRRGADDGKSSIANVFVYVLDEQKQLVMVMGLKPTEVEKHVDNITTVLHNTTGFDIRIRKLEPHAERNQLENGATDMYLYAVDPVLNTVVDMDNLQRILKTKQNEIEEKLGPKVLSFTSGPVEKYQIKTPRIILSALEISVVALGCVVLLGALVTAICVLCLKRRKRRLLQKNFSHPLGYPLTTGGPLGKPSLFPAAFGDGLRYADASDMLDMTQTHTGYHRRHDINCPRSKPAFAGRSRCSGGIEKSITSLHSSGRDSGIVDGAAPCQCGHSSSQCSEESSNSYEDSLRSVPHSGHRMRDPSNTPSNLTTTGTQHRRSRNRSITEDIIEAGGLHRIQSMSHLPAGPSSIFIPGPSALRRSTERLMMTCSNEDRH